MKPRRPKDKLLARREAAAQVRRAQRRGARVVFTSGCFDLLHPGHLRSLREARGFGDLLIVAVNDDAGVRRLKGTGRPLLPARARAEMLANLECVDYVLVFSGKTPRAVLAALRPDVYAKGGDWPLKVLREQDVPASLADTLEIRRLRQVPGWRSSALVRRIRAGRRK